MTRHDIAAPRRDEPRESNDAATPATAVLDAWGRVTAWSEGARRLLGHRAEEVVGRGGAGLLSGDTDQPEGPAPGGRSWSGHVVLRHRNGFDVRVALLARRRETAFGSDWLVVRVADSRLSSPRRDETLMRWGFGEFPCILALFDTDLLLVRANADMEEAVGLSEEQLQGLRPSEMLSARPERGSIEDAMREAVRKDERRHLRAFLCKPGEESEHAWAVCVAPAKDEDGRLRGVCFTAQDHTDQYSAQRRLQVLNKAGTRIGTTLDIRRTAQQLADVAVPDLADFVSVDLLTFLERGEEPPPGVRSGPVVLRRAGQRSVTGGKPEDLVVPGDVITYPQLSALVESLEGRRTTTPEASRDLLTRWAPQDPERAARLRSQGIHSVMVVPMRARGLLLGVTVFMRHARPESFSEDDMLLAEELTARAGVSLDNARRYIAERNRAETLQRDLLPQRLPDLSAVETAARYLPARQRAGVGGDWFDVIPLSSARVALVVGDVVGHGLQASGAMARFRTAVRALADMGLPPDELLTRLDDMVTRLSDEDGAAGAKYVGATCLYAVYDPVSRLCTVACAGHPLPLVVGPSGDVEIMDLPTGPPLGVGGMPFEASESELPEGSVLAFYTNGLIETRHRDIDEGIELFRRTLAEAPPSLEAACNHVVATLLREPPRDDAALLLARTRTLSPDQVATWELPAEPAAVARIRDGVADLMRRWELEELAFSTELVVSELVTNAIRHGHSPIQLRLIHDRELICEVSDAGIAAPHLRPANLMDEGGRGLLLVAQLCRRWGVRYGTQGKTIWAEQSSPADHQPHPAM